jgi:chromosomal replication initiation ATPase DnaA
MTRDDIYKNILETKLVERFKKEFHEKIGYYPIVITEASISKEEGSIKIIPLEELKKMFTPFLPYKYQKMISLGSRSRIRELVELRHIYCFLAKQMGYSLKEIARCLNNRDHSTAINSIKVFHDLHETNELFRNKYIKILNHIKQSTNESPALDYEHKVSDKSQPDVHT